MTKTFLLNMSQNSTIKKLREYITKLFGLPLTIISFYFILKILYGNQKNIPKNILHIDILQLISGFFFLFLYFFLRGVSWNQILKKQGYEHKIGRSIYLFWLSETKRYIPGNLFSFISRVKNFKEEKIPSKTIVKSLFIEGLLLVSSALFVSLFSLPVVLRIFSNINFNLLGKYHIFIFAPIILLFIVFAFILLIRNKKLMLKDLKFILVSYSDVFFIFTLGWFFFGIGNFLIASSFSFINPVYFLVLASYFVFSWLIGYLSFITPMGLGVRELVLVLGLSLYLPAYTSSYISIFLRIVLIVSEIIFFLLSKFFKNVSFDLRIFGTKCYQQLILLFSVISYIIYFSYVSIQKHLNFFTGRFDLGNMDQTVWNTIHGRFFQLTNPDSVNIVSRLSIHSDFMLILLSPLYLIWQDPRMLLVIQTVIIGLGAIFVYKIAEHILKNRNLALVFSISYLLNPFVQKQNLYDFHSVTFATTFLLASTYYLIRNKYKWFILFIILSALTKENIYLVAMLFGLFIFLNKKKKFGIILATVSLAIFYFIITKLIPDARNGAEHFALAYFSEFGSTPAGIIKNIFLNPIKTFNLIFNVANFEYIIELFVPVGFLSFIAPFFIVFSFPDLLLNIMSTNSNLKSINYHYAAVIIPFVYVSAVFGVKKIISLKLKLFNSKVLFYFIFLASILSTWLYGVLPGTKNPALEVFNRRLPEREKIQEFLDKIPSNLSVAATNNLGAHLSHRENIYTIPNGIDKADIILFLLNDEFAQPSLNDQKKMVVNMRNDSNYIQVYKKGEFIAFERKNLELSKKILKGKPEIFPYAIDTLQNRSYQQGILVTEKLISHNSYYKEYLVSYLSDGLRLYALVDLPNIKPPLNGFPVVLIVHDLSISKKYNSVTSEEKISQYFASRGYIAIKPDLRGFGQSESQGGPLERFAYPIDVLNLIYSLPSLENIDYSNIFLYGRGMGAEIILKVLEVTAKDTDIKETVRAAALVSPISDTIAYFEDQDLVNGAYKSYFKKIYSEIGAPDESVNKWKDLSPISYANDIKNNILIFYPENDELIKESQSKDLYDILSFKNPETQFVTLEDQTHELTSAAQNNVLSKTLEYFGRNKH